MLFRMLALLPVLFLAGCYTSDREFVSAKQAVFPYKKIVYQSKDSDKPTTITHVGAAYVGVPDDPGKPPVEFRFMPVGGPFYLAQFKGYEGKKVQYLFAVVKLDAEAKTVWSYAAAAEKEDQGPELRSCGKRGHNDTDICLTRIEPYLIHALAGIAAGAKPFDQYTLLTLE